MHPSFPVIDAKAFLKQYAAHGFEGINLLLLWSIFSVSASYVESLALGRKKCKEMYSARAKLLFDLGQENDKIVLGQSALLMSYWYSNPVDVKQSLYWTCIAFSIAQSFGLHAITPPKSQEEILWYDIWQCCLLRDTWQAFGKGRPLRLLATSSEHSTTTSLGQRLSDLVLHGELLYSPREAIRLGTLWDKTLGITNVVRGLLTKRPLSLSEAKDMEDGPGDIDYAGFTTIIEHAERDLELRRCAARIMWAKLTDQTEEQRRASDGMTAILRTSVNGDERSPASAAPFSIPLLVPPIATYLAAVNNRDEDALAQLDVYEHFLIAIEDNYPAASMLQGVMLTARETVLSRDVGKDGSEGWGTGFENQSELSGS